MEQRLWKWGKRVASGVVVLVILEIIILLNLLAYFYLIWISESNILVNWRW